MKTTLNPPPTDREREMLAEWVSVWLPIMVAQEKFDPYKDAMQRAENTLFAYRERYGVTGEANHNCRHCGVETTQPDSECYKAPAPADITDLQLENARLRKALEEIAYASPDSSPANFILTAEIALKGGTK